MDKYINRNSGIELLKIIALILIAFSHSMPWYDEQMLGYMNLNLATGSVQRFVIVLYRYCGGIGNAIFIVSTSWFMVGNNKLKLKKIINMWLDVFIISIVFLLVFSAIGVNLSSKDILIQFMPMTFRTNWFICCYVIFCFINPAINLIISHLDKKKHFYITLIMFLIYCCLGSLHEDVFYYTQLVGFIVIYMIVSYIKLYMKRFSENIKLNIKLFIATSIALFILVLSTNIIGLHFTFMADKLIHWANFKNPIIVIMAITVFNIFKNFSFKNKFINYLSSTSLLFYLIHENYIFAHCFRGQIYSYIYMTFSYQYELLWVTLIAIFLIVFGFVGGYFTKKQFNGYHSSCLI